MAWQLQSLLLIDLALEETELSLILPPVGLLCEFLYSMSVFLDLFSALI